MYACVRVHVPVYVHIKGNRQIVGIGFLLPCGLGLHLGSQV